MKKKFIFLMSAFAVMLAAYATITTAAKKAQTADIVYDFSAFDAATDTPTSDLWSYTDDPQWANIRNASALEEPTAINTRLANILFTCSGSGNIVWQLYAGGGMGNQLVINSSGVSAKFTEVKAGDNLVFYATANREAQLGDYTIAKNADYAEYTLVADADAPTIALPRGLTIRTITIKKAAAAVTGKTWDFTKFSAESIEGLDDKGNLTGSYDADPTKWSAVKNSAAVDGKLMLSETKEFPLTEGISFKAASGKLFVRNYPEANGGCHLFSNDNSIEMSIPTAAGNVVVVKATSLKNNPTLAVISGAEEEGAVIANSYDYYTFHATADVLNLKYARNIAIKQIYTGEAPTPADPALTVAANELEIIMGETATIEYQTKSDIAPKFTSSDEEVATVDATGKVSALKAGTAVITVLQAANAYFTESKQEVTVTVKMPGSNKIEELLADALEKAQDGAATLTLDGAGEYTLDEEAAAGFVNLTIEGNGAKIVLGEAGAISAKQGLTIKNVNIDAANGKAAPVQLASMVKSVKDEETGESVETPDAALFNLHGANGKNAYFNEQAITLEKVNVSGLTTALIQTQKCDGGGWCLKNLNIKNSIIQLNATGGKFLDWQSNGGDALIKNINLEGNTIYNIQANDQIYFLAYNTSKPMPNKFYGDEDNTCTWTMTNNIFAQCFRQMSDRYTENKVATVKWTKNVWYGHTNLTKTRNCTFEMTAADNSGDGTVSLGSFGTKETLMITVPTEAFDFNVDALLPYFSLFKRTQAYENRMGDTRWLAEGKVAEGRTWDFSANATNYPEEWAAIVADETNWNVSKTNQRYQNNVALDGTEAQVNVTEVAEQEPTVVTRNIKFMEGLFWTADVKKLLIGNGDTNYNCLQIQKGAKFTVKGLYAGDVIAVTACSTTKNEEADNIRFTNAYPDALAVAKAGEYTEYTVTAVSDGEVTFEAAKDVRLQKLAITPMAADYSYPGLAIRLANDIAKDVENTDEGGNVTVKEYNTKGVRMMAGDKDGIVATTKNAMVPVTYTSSDENVITVDAEGNFTAVAPGTATITVEQAKGAGFYGSTVKRFIVVNNELAYHPIAINMQNEQAELVYTPDAIGYVAGADNNNINDYHVLPAYSGWMFYNNGNDGDGYVQAKTGSNSWMKIDYRDGANDAECNEQCPNSETTGTNACYRPTVSGSYDLTMDYYVTGVEKVKFYYCTSASKVGGLRLNIYEDGKDEPVYSIAGVSDQKGKGANGLSFTVEQAGLDMTKGYKVRALREGDGDVLVYAVKFYGDGTTHGSTVITGIQEMVVVPMNSNVVYDLQGRRVSTLKSGQLYIKNGKKFLNK